MTFSKIEEGETMTQLIMSTKGRYEIAEVEYGRVYKWHPAQVVAECECGQRLTLTNSTTACGECGEDHAGDIQEWMGAVAAGAEEDDKVTHPWRYWHSSSEDNGMLTRGPADE